MSEIRSKRNINLNIQNIVVATYIKGRPVRLGHISVKIEARYARKTVFV